MFRGSARTQKRGIFSNFCGPGGFGLPQHAVDKICATHDDDYDMIIKQGKNPYTNFNWADEKMVKALDEIAPQSVKEQLLKQTAKAVWKIKEVAIGNDGSIEYITPPVNNQKRKRDQSSKSPASKKLNMVRKTDDGDVNMDLVAPPGAPSQLRIAASQSAMMGVGHGETSVDPYSYVKKSPWKPSETVLMTYFAVTGAATVTDATPLTYSYRLNSIYDCRDNGTYSDTEPIFGAIDTADTTLNTPTWRNYWMTFYNYWTVTQSRYRVRFRIDPVTDTSKETELIAYVYHHGAQKPPLFASGSTLLDHQFRRQHQGMYYFPIRYYPDNGFNNVEQYDKNVCSGSWTPGSIKHEVAEDELQQIWHKIQEAPPTREGLTIIIQKSPTNRNTEAITVRTEISIEYTVQVKDLKRDYQYPHQLTAVPAIAAAAAQGN